MILANLESLGRTEYWIVDPEEKVPVIKSACPPIMLGPGWEVTVPATETQARMRYPMPVGDWPMDYAAETYLGLGSLASVAAGGYLLYEGHHPVMAGALLVTGLLGGYHLYTKKKESFPFNLFGLDDLGQDYWEALHPGGGVVALFRCRPFWMEREIALKQVTRRPGGPVEILRVPGAADEPEGTERVRRGTLFTSRRG